MNFQTSRNLVNLEATIAFNEEITKNFLILFLEKYFVHCRVIFFKNQTKIYRDAFVYTCMCVSV